MSTIRSAVKMAQAILAHGDPLIKVDGVWGPKTSLAYITAKPRVRSLVESGIDVVFPGATVSDMSVKVEAVPATIAPKGVENIILSASREFGIGASALMALVAIESNFNPKAISASGNHFGLGQMSSVAWMEAQQYVNRKGMAPIGSFEKEKFNPYENIRATAAYIKVNSGYLRSKGYRGPITVDVLYLAHQQGAGGFMQVYRAAKQGAKVSAEVVHNMIANPPQDGKGAARHPQEFFERWASIAAGLENKYS